MLKQIQGGLEPQEARGGLLSSPSCPLIAGHRPLGLDQHLHLSTVNPRTAPRPGRGPHTSLILALLIPCRSACKQLAGQLEKLGQEAPCHPAPSPPGLGSGELNGGLRMLGG